MPKLLAVVAVFSLLAGCSSLTGDDPSWIRAELTAARLDGVAGTDRYAGGGEFYEGPDEASGVRVRFDVSSAGADGQALLLHGRNYGRPPAGTYQLRNVDQGDPAASGYTIYYQRVNGDSVEYYAAERGELRVTSSSAERVQGEFSFTGYRYCAFPRTGTGQSGSCRPPAVPLTGVPTLTASGSFSVARFSGDDLESLVATRPIPFW